jgi:hypothetical protein
MGREEEEAEKEREYFTDDQFQDDGGEEIYERYNVEEIGQEKDIFEEEDDEEDDDIDPVEYFLFRSLKMVGIQSILTTIFLATTLEGGLISLPFTGAYSITACLLDRKKIMATNTSLLREIGRDMSRRSLSAGIFFGTFAATSDALSGLTNSSDLTVSVVSGMTAVSLATVSYRKPRLVLPGLGVLMGFAFLGLVP